MISISTRMVGGGLWRWFLADGFGNPLLMSASSFSTREGAELDFSLVLPIIRKLLF